MLNLDTQFLCTDNELLQMEAHLKIFHYTNAWIKKWCYGNILFKGPSVNSSPPSAAHMCRWTGTSLVQVIAWCKKGDKSIPELILIYCQMDPKEQISVINESKFKHFHSRKYVWKCRLRNGGHFVQGEINVRQMDGQGHSYVPLTLI